MKEHLRYCQEPGDNWDRPDGDWGEGSPDNGETLQERRNANFCYRLGSLALSQGDLRPAEGWLTMAMKAHHPGAWFRCAALVSRRGYRLFGGDGPQAYFRYLIEGAADRGHGDARQILLLLRDRSAKPLFESWEDPIFGPEILYALRSVLREQ
ncbi:hypothetical protein [Streptomyces sp. A1136]|uniref:hypothetical protein n=1 Tax=Streptomyces sp. A1136 TaxID=2563102 RepID=UPI00109E4DC3|nr:hypothetical protein [Streptomyces sp. A1136]THA49411.1 hypothetical protein E6R62_27865 [Streptomyces sp. A1136]